MDYMRGTYYSSMVLWEGGEPIPGYWFPAPEGAEVLTDFSPFRAKTVWDHPEDEPTPLGESATQPFVFRGLGNTVGYDGLHFCGPLESFERGGIPGVDQEIETQSDGSAPCCETVLPPPVYMGCSNVQPNGLADWSLFWLGLNVPGQVGILFWSQFSTSTIPVLSIPGFDLVESEERSVIEFGADQFMRMSVYRRVFTGDETEPLTWSDASHRRGGGTLVVFEEDVAVQSSAVQETPDEGFATLIDAPQVTAGPNAQVITHITRLGNTIVFDEDNFPNPICPYITGQTTIQGRLNQSEQIAEGLTPALAWEVWALVKFGIAGTYSLLTVE